MYSAIYVLKKNARRQRSLEITAVFLVPSPFYTRKTWNFEFIFGGFMDQNVLFQMTPNSMWFLNGINFWNCFKDDFGEKNIDHLYARSPYINARSAV